MNNKSFRHVAVLAAASLLAGFCLPFPSRAQTGTVLPGFDLLQTLPGGTLFDGVNFTGDPLGTFNFAAYGGPAGDTSVNAGNTDTIVQRLNTVNTPGGTALQVDALQLESTTPYFGGQYAFITLNPSDLSLDTGWMSFNPLASGTFISTLNVYYDVWIGAIGGILYTNGKFTLNSFPNWQHAAPSGALLIPGVNYELNGVDTSEDFFPFGTVSEPSSPFTETNEPPIPPVYQEVQTVPETVPEPSKLALLLIPGGLFALCMFRRKIARRA